MFYVEYKQTIVFRAPIPNAATLEEANKLVEEDRIDYNKEEIVGSDDDFEMLKVYEEVE